MIAFIEFSRNIELSKKIKTFVALAPVAEVGHIKGLLKVLSYAAPETQVHCLSFRQVFFPYWFVRCHEMKIVLIGQLNLFKAYI